MPRVSAILPNFNGVSLLKKFLPSVLQTLESGDEVLIVDDASSDTSVGYLIQTYRLQLTKKTMLPTKVSDSYVPQHGTFTYKLYSNTVRVGTKKIQLSVIALDKNVRFAMAANCGVLFARNPYVFLLNTDVKPTKQTRSALVSACQDPNIFAVGCLEYERSVHGEKSGKNKLWFAKGLFWHSKADSFESGETAWASGGSALFSKEKWVELAGFDSQFYPAYWEDVDLSFRAKKRGWKVLFSCDAVVFHVHESTNQTAFGNNSISEMSWHNAIKFTKKHASLWQLLQFYVWYPYWKRVQNKSKENIQHD